MQPSFHGNRYKPIPPVVMCERFMSKHLAAYGGYHNVPAIMYRMCRNKYVKGSTKRTLKIIFAYEYR